MPIPALPAPHSVNTCSVIALGGFPCAAMAP